MFAVLENMQAHNYYDVIFDNGFSYSGLTAEDYRKQGYIVLLEEEANKIVNQNQNKKFIEGWTEITEDEYWDALETLPPVGFVSKSYGELFWFREFLISDITNVYVCIKSPNGNRFFRSAKRFTNDYRKIFDDLFNYLQK